MLKLSSNINKIVKQLEKHEKKMQKAKTMAVNKVGFDVKDELTDTMDKYIDRPTPFTKKGWLLIRAKAGKNKAIVLLKDIQAKYLGYTIYGGKTDKTVVPHSKNATLNKYGNIAGKRTGLAKRKTEFIGKINNHSGVWRRVGRGKNKALKLIHSFKKSITVKKRYPVFKIAEKEVKKQWPVKFKRAMQKVFR